MEANNTPFEYCLYTAASSDELEKMLPVGGGSLSRGRCWTGGDTLFRKAKAQNRQMPILFGRADTRDNVDAYLMYYAWLTDLQLDDKEARTQITFTGITPIPGKLPLHTLVLVRTKGPLSDKYQRGYARCFTPDFVTLLPSVLG